MYVAVVRFLGLGLWLDTQVNVFVVRLFKVSSQK